MIRHTLLFVGVVAAVVGVVAIQDAAADDYVWTRTVWGSSNVNGHYSSMSNGYGGYYVRRSAYGNNYEATGNYTNPQGYIVPAGTPYVQQPVQESPGLFHRHRRWYR